MRIIKAMALLESGRTVESVTREFGYSSPSAFIAMFEDSLAQRRPVRERRF